MAEKNIKIFGSELKYESWQKDEKKTCTYYSIALNNINQIKPSLNKAFGLSDSFEDILSVLDGVQGIKFEYIAWTEKKEQPSEERALGAPSQEVNETVEEDNSEENDNGDNSQNGNGDNNQNGNGGGNQNGNGDATATIKTKAVIITYTKTKPPESDKAVTITSEKFELQVIRSSEYTIVVVKPYISLNIHKLPAANIAFNNPIRFVLEGVKIVKEKTKQSLGDGTTTTSPSPPPDGNPPSSASKPKPKGFYFKLERGAGNSISTITKEAYPLAFPVLFKFDLATNEEPMEPPSDMADVAASDPPVVDDGIQWIDIDTKIAAINIGRIGVSFKEKFLYAHLDASLETTVLGLYFMGLRAGINPSNLLEAPKIGIDGIGIGAKTGGMEIIGFLMSIPTTNPEDEEYAGQIIIQTPAFQIIGTAMYGIISGQTTFFLYAFLNRRLGGPIFFFIEGLAVGFGYNRTVDVPIDQVANFPLVAQAVNPPTMPVGIDEMRATANSLSVFIRPKVGMMVIMLGVKFSSFQLIKSFALIILTLGERIRLDILGISRLELGVPNSPPNVVLEIAIKASFIPDEGTIQVDGRITPNTFIFTEDIKITGGFALYLWFAGENAGDFAISMGGYHPKYNKPAHYPTVPRVALSWVVNPKLVFKGNLYFAMTPKEVMAGAKIYAKFKGKVSKFMVTADFYCSMDFMMSWLPFKYTADFRVRIRVRFRVEAFFLKASVDMGVRADVNIWGPEFGGTADVEVSIEVIGIDVGFGFTINFGNRPKASPDLLDWDKFSRELLPPAKKVISLSANQGVLKREQEDKGGEAIEIWTLNMQEVALEVQLGIPFTNYKTEDSKSIPLNEEFSTSEPEETLLIPTMGNKVFSSDLKVSIVKNGENSIEEVPDKFEIIEVVEKRFPRSIWDKESSDSNKKTISLYSGVIIGYVGSTDTPDRAELPSDNLKYSIEEFKYSSTVEDIDYDFGNLSDLLQQDVNIPLFTPINKQSATYQTLMANPIETSLV